MLKQIRSIYDKKMRKSNCWMLHLSINTLGHAWPAHRASHNHKTIDAGFYHANFNLATPILVRDLLVHPLHPVHAHRFPTADIFGLPRLDLAARRGIKLRPLTHAAPVVQSKVVGSVSLGKCTSEGNSIKALDGSRQALEKISCFSYISRT